VASVVFALATIPIGLSVFMDDGKMWKPVTGYRSAGAVPQYMGGYSNIQGQSPKALAAQIARAQYAQ